MGWGEQVSYTTMTVMSVQLKLITASDTNSCYGSHKSSMQPLISSIMNFHGNSSQQKFPEGVSYEKPEFL